MPGVFTHDGSTAVPDVTGLTKANTFLEIKEDTRNPKCLCRVLVEVRADFKYPMTMRRGQWWARE